MWKMAGLGTLLAMAGCAQHGASLSGPGAYAAAGGVDDQSLQSAADMAGVYGHVCLDAFPDQAAVSQALQGYNADLMSGGEVMAMLHADPGRGWRIATPTARYVVTIEDPPYNTCAVRRMTRVGLPTARPYIAAMNAYAGRHGLAEAPVVQLNQQMPTGASVQMLGTPLMAAGNPKPAETSMYVSTNYHGRFDTARYPEAAGGVGVEVRMAHQISPP